MDNSLILSGMLIFLLAGAVVYLALRLQKQATALARGQFLSEQLEEKGQFQTRLEERVEQYRRDLEAARQAEKLALQKLEQAEQYKQEREKDRQEFEKSARSSVMAIAQEVSSKLLTDHKREAEEVKKQFSVETVKTHEELRNQFKNITEEHAVLKELSVKNSERNDVLWRTFSSPSSTGRLAEVGLENLLKNMGLNAGSDYIMQYTVTSGDGSGLRPDCVIKLPNNRVVVIDCKASKHVLAIAEAADSESEEIQNQKFLATMREHLKALTRKDYVNAIQQESFLSRQEIPASQLTNVMYLPSSAAVELIYKLDPELIDRSEKQGIILIGPGMLHGLIYLISREISDDRKLANQERIIQEVEKLLGALAATFGHITRVGGNIQTLASSFSKISGSFNRQVAPKLRNLEAFGIKSQSGSKMPQKLESYELRSMNETIDLAAEEEEAIASLEDFRSRKEIA